jgi:transposase
MLDAEERIEISVLSRHGQSIRSIARVTGRSRNTVRRYLRGGGDITAKRKRAPDGSRSSIRSRIIFWSVFGQLRRIRSRRWFCSGRSARAVIGAGRRA